MIDIPVRLPTETKIKQVTCKDDLTVFLTAEGEVFTAGESEFRSCDIPTEVLCIFYRQLKLPGGLVIKAVYASSVIFLVSLKNELHYLDEFGEVRFIDHPAELKELVVGPYGLFARSRSGEHFEFLKDDEFDANPCFEKVAIENVSHVYAGPDYRIAVKAQNHSLKERLVQKIGNSKVQKQRNRTPLIQKPKNSDSRNTLMQDS
jgi:alpha-tubulin suppressor-like RCC1 family protein